MSSHSGNEEHGSLEVLAGEQPAPSQAKPQATLSRMPLKQTFGTLVPQNLQTQHDCALAVAVASSSATTAPKSPKARVFVMPSSLILWRGRCSTIGGCLKTSRLRVVMPRANRLG